MGTLLRVRKKRNTREIKNVDRALPKIRIDACTYIDVQQRVRTSVPSVSPVQPSRVASGQLCCTAPSTPLQSREDVPSARRRSLEDTAGQRRRIDSITGLAAGRASEGRRAALFVCVSVCVRPLHSPSDGRRRIMGRQSDTRRRRWPARAYTARALSETSRREKRVSTLGG